MSRERNFQTTHWSVVLRAVDAQSPEAREALEQLCRAYWYPLYAFVRRKGYGPHDAADLTQEFFCQLLRTHALDRVAPSKGRFRSFLLASLEHQLTNEWNRARCQKRGGGALLFSLDGAVAEERYALDPVDTQTPEKVFDRRWAESLLNRALARLREECDSEVRSQRFQEVKNFLLGEQKAASFAEAAARLSMTLGAVKGLVHRLRRRFRELIREEIAQTVAAPEEIDEEIRHLFAAFAG
jgi:RNA polymerase sigma factor (sigma-70 family)